MDYSKMKKARLIEEIKTLQEKIAEPGCTQAERKRAEEALQASYRHQASILGSMIDAVIVANPDGTIRTLNRAALELLGYAEQELIGQPVGTIFEEEAFFRGSGLAQLLREGAARDVELTLLAKSGERIPVVFNGSITRKEDGSLAAVVGVARDVREPRRLWDEILRADATLRALNAAALAVQRALQPEDVFRAVAGEMGKLGFLATIFLLDEDKKNLMVAHMSFSPKLTAAAEKLLGLSRNIKFPLDRMPQYMKEVLGNRVTVFSQDRERVAGFLPAHLRGLTGKLVEILGLQKGIIAPLVVEGKVIGALGVDSQELTENDVPAITAFANQAAIAIENARLFKAEHEQRELAESLEEAAAVVSSTLDPEEVLDHILEQAERVVAGDAFTVILIEDDAARLARWRGYELPGEEIQPSRFDIPMAKYSHLMKMARTGETVIVPDTSLDPNWVPTMRDQAWRRSYVGVPIQFSGVTVGFLGVSGPRPGQFGLEDARRMEALASHAATAIGNARLYEEIRQKVEELGLLLDTSTTISSTLESDQTLHILAEKMTTSVGATFCRIALLDEMSQTLTIRAAFATHDLDWDPALGRQYALADAPWHGRAIERGEAIILRQGDPSQAASETECRIALSEGIQSALLMALVVGDRPLGVVSLGEMRTWERLPFTAERVRLCQAMANQAAVAIRNAQLLDAVMKHRRDLQKLSTQLINAQEVERRRLSRELHDELGQALTMLSINLAAIEKELPSELAPTIRERLAEATSLVNQTLEQVRELSLDLRPTMLDDLGLVSALRWYVNRYAKRLNIEVKFEAIDLEERLPADMETIIYRVVQEALTNVARHAQANRVNLRLERKVHTVAALIEDDGQGFDVEKLAGGEAPERGAGLLGIRERVSSLGGSFSIQSSPGQGTRLTIEIPT